MILPLVALSAAGCGGKAPAPTGTTLSASSCLGGWRTIYQSAPGESSPNFGDLAWKDGTLFVAHSDVANSWLFSIPDHGGQRTDLTTGGQRRFWLEGDNLVFAQETDVYSMPSGGGTPTKLLHYRDSDPSDASPQSFAPVALDGSAFYWTYFTTLGNEVQRHFRGGGDDALLATIPESLLVGSSSVWTAQADDKLVFGFTSEVSSSAVAIPKEGGAPTQLPLPGPSASIPLAVSTSGSLLLTRATQDVVDPKTPAELYHHDLLLGAVDGSTPTPFETTLPRTVSPRSGWAAANHGWYLAGDEEDAMYHPYLSIWYIAGDGTASRLACREPSDMGTAARSSNLGTVGVGVVADGAIYVSLALIGGPWLIGRIDNPGAAPDNGDAGMPATDGSFDPPVPAACLPGAPAVGAGVAKGTIQEIPVPSPASVPEHMVVGADGNLWFTEDRTAKLGQLTPSGCITEFPLNGRSAVGLTAGPDGALWFTEPGALKIGRMTTAGAVQEFTLPSAVQDPDGIVAGPDGNLWFTDPLAISIARITPAGATTQYATAAAPTAIVASPTGSLWIGEGGKVGRVDPSSGAITEFVVPNASGVAGLTIGPDGNIWFAIALASGASLGRMTADGSLTTFPLPAGRHASHLVSGPDGNIWFLELDANNIAQLDLSTSAVTEFPIPTANSQPSDLVAGPDGNLWFVEGQGNQIGQLKM